MGLNTYTVSYTIDVDATDAADAAEQVRDLLSTPGVPERGSYIVTNTDTRDLDVIDFGFDEF